jgi:hypothetical protein
MKTRIISAAAAMMALGALVGCAGKTQQLQMRDGTGAAKEVVFPEGRLFGGVSQKQVGALAQMLADTNTATSSRLDTVDRTTGQTLDAASRIETKTDQIETATRDIRPRRRDRGRNGPDRRDDAADRRRDRLDRPDHGADRRHDREDRGDHGARRGDDQADRRHRREDLRHDEDGPRGLREGVEEAGHRRDHDLLPGRIEPDRARLAAVSAHRHLVDFLARESRGRKIMLVSVGSASAFGPPEINERLAKERSQAPLDIVDQYLVNLPHEYVKIYGTGDVYSPKDVTMKEHQRYQASRLIAFYERGQEPALPEEPAPGE